MEFCDICNNLLFVRNESGNNFSMYCKSCGFVKNDYDLSKPITKLSKLDASDEYTYKQYMNAYLEYDKTLPVVNNITCPNVSCSRPTDAPNKVMYLKYNARDLKYLYLCKYCKMFWKTFDNK